MHPPGDAMDRVALGHPVRLSDATSRRGWRVKPAAIRVSS